ncbi:hypothetical protein Aduo_015173 [Ancylostoma duodenale]
MASKSQSSPSGAMFSSLAWIAACFIACSATTAYQCWNFKQTDDIRELYLKRVNTLRQQIAQNTALCNGTTCPQGKNIYKLYWDCMLEIEAQKAVDKCTVTVNQPTDATIIIKEQILDSCNPTPLFKQTVNDWWNVVQTEGLDSNAIFNKDGLASFAALAHGTATRIGCAQKNCNGKFYLACMVYGKAPEKNQPIYELGNGCSSAADCTAFAGTKCNKPTGLCVAGYIDPTATTTTAPTTTIAEATTTTTIAATTNTSVSDAATTTTASGTTTSTAPPGMFI